MKDDLLFFKLVKERLLLDGIIQISNCIAQNGLTDFQSSLINQVAEFDLNKMSVLGGDFLSEFCPVISYSIKVRDAGKVYLLPYIQFEIRTNAGKVYLALVQNMHHGFLEFCSNYGFSLVADKKLYIKIFKLSDGEDFLVAQIFSILSSLSRNFPVIEDMSSSEKYMRLMYEN